jgi:branched-chain amino acid transport system permease protein
MSATAKTAVLVAVLAALAVVATVLKRSDVYLMTLCCVYLMATFGLNLTVGYAGQMSLGQAAFFGIGAYIAAIALKAGWPFFVVLPSRRWRASRSGSRSDSLRFACSTTTWRSPHSASTC